MSDDLLSINDQKEALSKAYIEAVAAGARFTTSEPKIDRDSVDITIYSGDNRSARLDIQLKATQKLGDPINGRFKFSLKLKNYNDLIRDTMVPRILVVLDLPENENEWLSVSPSELILRKCAYWQNLNGLPNTENTENITIHIKNSNRFDVAGLKELMRQAGAGKIE